MRPRLGWTGVLVLILIATACGPSATPERATSAPGAPSSPATPKVLTIGVLGEPPDFYGFSGSLTGGGTKQVPPIALDKLVVQNPRGEWQPQLAAEQISLERGTWLVHGDGSVDTIWKLRPNIKWHDGTPFTSADLLFTLTVRLDPDAGQGFSGRTELVKSASAPDPLTFIIHWSAPYIDADQGLHLDSLPKHLLEETYLNQKENLAKSPYLSSQFIGQGAYRLLEWQNGSHMVFTRFDDYYQGRPPLDRVIVRFHSDPNAMIASILSGAVDILLPSGVGLDAAVELQRRWAGTGHEVRFDLAEDFRQIELQFRPDAAKPRDGLTNLPVRQAFYHAIDRKSLADELTYGMSPVGDSWVAPTSALRSVLESSIPQYPYDPNRALQLLAGAGWVRSVDGTLVSRTTGERFATELRVAQPDEQKLMSAVAGQWTAIGAQVDEIVIPPAQANDREYSTLYGGGLFSTGSLQNLLDGRADSRQIRSAANRWGARNRSGYSNPRLDTLVDRANQTIVPTERIPVLGELLQAHLGDLVVLPLFWAVAPVLQLKGVKSHASSPDGRVTTWNFFEFDKQ